MLVGTGWEVCHRDPTTFSLGMAWLGLLVICTIGTVNYSVVILLSLP